jgi:hypothetical protein
VVAEVAALALVAQAVLLGVGLLHKILALLALALAIV